MVWTTSLFFSGFAQYCEYPDDHHGGEGGSTRGGHVSHGGKAGEPAAGTNSGGQGGGSFGGMSGSAGQAGSNPAGSAGLAGDGGSNATGGDGSGGAAGSSDGGLGGVAAGGGACGGASDTNCAGTSGSAGASGNGGSGGSNGDPSLPLLVSTQLIILPENQCGTVPTSSQAFTVTNPSSVTKTWTSVVLGPGPFFSVTPTGSSLAPGEVVTVTATPVFIVEGSMPNGSESMMRGGLAIIEQPDNVVHVIDVSDQILGAFSSWSPANLGFVVPLNGSQTLSLTQSGDSSGRLSADNPSFVASINPANWHEWTVTFVGDAVGTQTTTFTWRSPFKPECTLNTFTATGVVLPGAVQ
jgi:hypothetical protein